MKNKLCNICDRYFTTTRNGVREEKYCSAYCANRAKYKGGYYECCVCSRTVWRKPSQIKRSGHVYCSIKCRSEWVSKNKTGDQNNNWRGGISKKRKTGTGSKNNYKRGRRNEWKSRKLIEADGYYVARSAGSKGFWDLYCYRTTGNGPLWRVIQVKTNGNYSQKDVDKIANAKVPAASKELWVWWDRKRLPEIIYFIDDEIKYSSIELLREAGYECAASGVRSQDELWDIVAFNNIGVRFIRICVDCNLSEIELEAIKECKNVPPCASKEVWRYTTGSKKPIIDKY